MTANTRQQELLAVFDRLDARRQDMLMDFAAALASREAGAEPVAMRPEPRPAAESVVAAIRRLARACPAAERRRLMSPVSLLMAQHALQERPAAEVIDELEALFARRQVKTARSDPW